MSRDGEPPDSSSEDTLRSIIAYLKNPLSVGVHNLVVMVDLKGVLPYRRELLDQFEKSHEPEVEGKYPPAGVRISRSLKEALAELEDHDSSQDEYLSTISKVLGDFAYHCDCPAEMKNVFVREVKHSIGGREHTIKRPRHIPILSSRLMREVGDVIQVSNQRVSPSKWLFDVTSIKESGVSHFKTVACSVPPIRAHLRTIKEWRRHSSRYSFRPYPLAARLWLGDETSSPLPADLKSFLAGAVDYISQNEWRTSIILSAIAIESELADIYEETYKSPAPDVPLGDLFQKVKSKVEFPEDIAQAVETTNRARIAAVHRSRLPVSQREAVNALYGAVNFTQWHIFDGQ
jgi:hypothetical protein